MKTIKLFTLFIITVIVFLIGIIINDKLIVYGGMVTSMITLIIIVNEEKENEKDKIL